MAKLNLTILALTFLVAACTEAQFTDVETNWVPAFADEALPVEIRNPDSIVVYRNINLHPNLAVICIEGVAFVTTTREASQLRVEALDKTCLAADK